MSAVAAILSFVLVGLAPAASPRASPVAVESVAIAAEGVGREALVEALTLRAPGLRVLEAGAACEGGCLAVTVRRESGTIAFEARAADGRVFRRSLGAVAEGERAVATSLAHLVEALVEGRSPPAEVVAASDATGVTRQGAGAGDEAGSGEVEARRTGEGEVGEDGLGGRESAGATDGADAVDATTDGADATDGTGAMVSGSTRAPGFGSTARVELGATLGLATAFGVGPPRALAGRVGTGFAGEIEGRWRGGALVIFGVRSLEAREGGLRLERVRVAVGGGYGLRRGRFDLRAVAALTVEPWWVVTRADGGHASGGVPPIGGLVGVAPGVGATLGPDLRARVGVRAEAAVSVHPREGGVIQATGADGAPLFRLGGVELAVMVEIGLAWGVRGERARGRAGRGE